MRERIIALLKKTTKNGCSPAEAEAALDKARELAEKYAFGPYEFQWPVAASASPKARKPRTKAESDHGSPKQAGGLGVGKLARELILAHPDWTYGQIAEEVNRRIEGAKATEKSVRWYSNAMRREGIEGTRRSH